MPTYTVAIRGTKFRPPEAKEVAKNLTPHQVVTLEPDPNNEYDSNAVQIIVQGQFIGFIQKDMAEIISPIIQAEEGPVEAYVSEDRDPQSGLHFIEVTI